jgi:hypothetical protein
MRGSVAAREIPEEEVQNRQKTMFHVEQAKELFMFHVKQSEALKA